MNPTMFKTFSTSETKQIENEDAQPEKRLQFSAFARKERDYSIDIDAENKKKTSFMDAPFVPKPEYTTIKFDPNIRHRMDTMDNTLIYRALKGLEPDVEPQSMYCAVQYEGRTWHLFNAKRMPLGRIAELAAGFLRGKNKPTYVARLGGVDGDNVVIVNAAEQFMTGRKASQKIYRKYTGYVGHLRTTSMKHMLEKKPDYPLRFAIKGMIPKNRLREEILARRLFIYPGAFHPHFKQGLPQFMEQDPNDINEEFDYGKMVERRHNYKVIFESDPNDLPEEFADVERDIDHTIGDPIALEKKTHTTPRSNTRQTQYHMTDFRQLGKYKKHRK